MLFGLAIAWAMLSGVYVVVAYHELTVAGYTFGQSFWYLLWRWFLVVGLPGLGASRLMDDTKEWRRKECKQLDGPQGQTDKEQGQD